MRKGSHVHQTYFAFGQHEFTDPIIEIRKEFGETREPQYIRDIEVVPNHGTVIIAANGVRSIEDSRYLLAERRIKTAFIVVIDHRFLEELQSLASGDRRVFESHDALRSWYLERRRPASEDLAA
jgi:hypothetical protein